MTFKKLVKELSKAQTKDDVRDIMGLIDRSWDTDKITWDDHEMLYDIASNLYDYFENEE